MNWFPLNVRVRIIFQIDGQIDHNAGRSFALISTAVYKSPIKYGRLSTPSKAQVGTQHLGFQQGAGWHTTLGISISISQHTSRNSHISRHTSRSASTEWHTGTPPATVRAPGSRPPPLHVTLCSCHENRTSTSRYPRASSTWHSLSHSRTWLPGHARSRSLAQPQYRRLHVPLSLHIPPWRLRPPSPRRGTMSSTCCLSRWWVFSRWRRRSVTRLETRPQPAIGQTVWPRCSARCRYREWELEYCLPQRSQVTPPAERAVSVSRHSRQRSPRISQTSPQPPPGVTGALLIEIGNIGVDGADPLQFVDVEEKGSHKKSRTSTPNSTSD